MPVVGTKGIKVESKYPSYIMNKMQPFAKRHNWRMLKAPYLATLELQIQ